MHKLDEFLVQTGLGDDTLLHFGVKGMRWGVRKREAQLQKAERILGRKVTEAQFGGKITNRGIKYAKGVQDLSARYKKVKKPDDPIFEWVRGHDPRTGISLNNRQLDRLVTKLEKKPTRSAKKLYETQKRIVQVKRVAIRAALATALVVKSVT